MASLYECTEKICQWNLAMNLCNLPLLKSILRGICEKYDTVKFSEMSGFRKPSFRASTALHLQKKKQHESKDYHGEKLLFWNSLENIATFAWSVFI